MSISLIGSSYNLLLRSDDSYTLHAGTNRYLLVFSHNECTYDYHNPVVFGGVTMTKFEDTGLEASHNPRVQIWGLAIPDGWSGSKSFSGTVVEGSDDKASIIELANVNPDSPKRDSDSQRNGACNAMSITVSGLSCVSGGYVVDVVQLNDDVGGLSPGASQTRLVGNTDSQLSLSRYTTPIDGNVTMSWSHNQTCGDMAAISLNPALPGDFALSSPSDEQKNLRVSDVDLSWEAADDATGYEYRYSTSPGGGSWIDNGNSTSVNLSGLEPGETYYWSVRAYNDGGDTVTESGEWSFETVTGGVVIIS